MSFAVEAEEDGGDCADMAVCRCGSRKRSMMSMDLGLWRRGASKVEYGNRTSGRDRGKSKLYTRQRCGMQQKAMELRPRKTLEEREKPWICGKDECFGRLDSCFGQI